jgi:hypothetical protein
MFMQSSKCLTSCLTSSMSARLEFPVKFCTVWNLTYNRSSARILEKKEKKQHCQYPRLCRVLLPRPARRRFPLDLMSAGGRISSQRSVFGSSSLYLNEVFRELYRVVDHPQRDTRSKLAGERILR